MPSLSGLRHVCSQGCILQIAIPDCRWHPSFQCVGAHIEKTLAGNALIRMGAFERMLQVLDVFCNFKCGKSDGSNLVCVQAQKMYAMESAVCRPRFASFGACNPVEQSLPEQVRVATPSRCVGDLATAPAHYLHDCGTAMATT
jgi:hypothetical protein